MEKEKLGLVTSIKLDRLWLSKVNADWSIIDYQEEWDLKDMYRRIPAIDIIQAEEIIINLLKELWK